MNGGNDNFNMSFNPEELFMVGRELKSPLSAMNLELQFLRQGLDSKNLDVVTQSVEQIELSMLKLDRISDALDKIYTYQNSQTKLFDLSSINVSAPCNDAISEMRKDLLLQGVKVQTNIPKSESLVFSNFFLLKSILEIFIQNAIPYHQNQEIRLDISEKRSKNIARISVRDFGPAIEKSIFTNRAKKQETIARRPQMSSVGLFCAMKFCDMINAKMGVVRHNDGASFFVDVNLSKQLELL